MVFACVTFLSPAKSEDRKSGEGKTDTNLTNFLSTDAAPGTPTRRHALGRLPTRPLCRKICHSDCTENCPLRPLRAPRRFRNPKIGQQLGAQPTPRFRVMIDAMDRRRDQCNDRRRVRCRDRPMAALHFLLPTGHSQSGRRSFDSKLNLPSPARRGSRSRPPLRRPLPLRFERLRVPVWNPYSRGRLGPAKSEDRKSGEGKTDANLTIFFKHLLRQREVTGAQESSNQTERLP